MIIVIFIYFDSLSELLHFYVIIALSTPLDPASIEIDITWFF